MRYSALFGATFIFCIFAAVFSLRLEAAQLWVGDSDGGKGEQGDTQLYVPQDNIKNDYLFNYDGARSGRTSDRLFNFSSDRAFYSSKDVRKLSLPKSLSYLSKGAYQNRMADTQYAFTSEAIRRQTTRELIRDIREQNDERREEAKKKRKSDIVAYRKRKAAKKYEKAEKKKRALEGYAEKTGFNSDAPMPEPVFSKGTKDIKERKDGAHYQSDSLGEPKRLFNSDD